MKTIVFDFDGTIADSFETLVGIFEGITKRRHKLTPAEIKNLRGQSLSGIIKYLKIKKWQLPRLMVSGKRQIALKMIDIKPYPGLPAVLKKLNAQGYTMLILSTNSSDNISSFLKNHGLDRYFEKVYGNIGLRGKATALKKVMKAERLKAADCIYIGDEVRDVLASKKAGVTHIAVGWGFNFPETLKLNNPDALAETPADLPKLLENL